MDWRETLTIPVGSDPTDPLNSTILLCPYKICILIVTDSQTFEAR
jgi:hypothetical protein